jgi:chorismate mutase
MACAKFVAIDSRIVHSIAERLVFAAQIADL